MHRGAGFTLRFIRRLLHGSWRSLRWRLRWFRIGSKKNSHGCLDARQLRGVCGIALHRIASGSRGSAPGTFVHSSASRSGATRTSAGDRANVARAFRGGSLSTARTLRTGIGARLRLATSPAVARSHLGRFLATCDGANSRACFSRSGLR
jgi:hypothetical protein